MKAIGLLYHDVVEPGDLQSSGFRGPDADLYKLTVEEFRRQLAALSAVLSERPRQVCELTEEQEVRLPVLLTFDDGGASAIRVIAPLLAERGWKAHFFVTTDYIGQPGFLGPTDILELGRLGHLVGSHSASHPLTMARCSPCQLRQEWTRSTEALAAILGRPVQVASIPGGLYSRAVALAAEQAGIRFLFTSEPVMRTWTVGNCLVLGRFSILHGTPPRHTVALVQGRWHARLPAYASWNAKKLLKIAAGGHWLRLRRWLLARRGAS